LIHSVYSLTLIWDRAFDIKVRLVACRCTVHVLVVGDEIDLQLMILEHVDHERKLMKSQNRLHNNTTI
jgi:hypothetical protein